MVRDIRAEEWLKREGMAFRYDPAGDLSRINHMRTADSQSRMGEKLDEALIEDYREGYAAGDPFPALIVTELPPDTPGGDIVVHAGHHRAPAATRAGRQEHDWYVLEVTESLAIEAVARFDNRFMGKREDRRRAIQHALGLHARGMSLNEAAERGRLPRSVVQAAWREQQGSDRIHQVGLNPEKFNKASIERLHRIKSGPAFGEAAKLVFQSGLAGEALDALVHDVEQAPSDEAKLEVIAQIAERPEVKDVVAKTRGGKRAAKLEPSTRLFRAMEGLVKLLSKPSLSALGVTNEIQRARYAELRGQIQARLEQLGNERAQSA